MAKQKRTQARSRRRQAREINQIDAMERRLERTAMPKIRKELNIIAKQAIQTYEIYGQQNAERVVEAGEQALSDTIESVYRSTIRSTEKLLKENYPKDKKKVEQVKKELERNFKKQAKRAAKQISESTKKQIDRVIKSGEKNELTEAEVLKNMKNKIGKNGRRAQIISQVEIGSVTAEGRDKLSKKIYEKDTRKVWVTMRDSKVRDPHQDAEGQTVDINEDFVLYGKRKERAPYPRYRGLSPAQRINCLLPNTKIGLCNPKRIFRRLYTGEVLGIKVDGLDDLSVTPNHPILTESGWKPAGLINEGDKVVVDSTRNFVKINNADIKGVDATVSKLFDSLVQSGAVPRFIGAGVNFHGDIAETNVEVVDVSSPLPDSWKPQMCEPVKNTLFELSNSLGLLLPSDSSIDKFLFASLLPTNSGVSSFRDFINLLFSCFAKSDFVGFASVPDIEAEFRNASVYCSSSRAELLRHSEDGHALMIQGLDFINEIFPSLFERDLHSFEVLISCAERNPHDFGNFKSSFPTISELLCCFLSLSEVSKGLSFGTVTKINKHKYEGPVYNIEDDKIFYTASAVVNHNCRCKAIYLKD